MQNLTPYFSDEDYVSLTLHLQELLDQLEQLPHPQVRETVFDVLGSIDMMHREALVRMLILAQQQAPELLSSLEQDMVIRSVLALYELLPSPETAEPAAPARNVTFIPLEQIGVSPALKMPVWLPAGHIDDLPPGTLKAQRFEDVDVVLYNEGGQVFALRNACLDSILPLSAGRADGYILNCPWHGCQYDVRTGEILNGSHLKLETFPVKVAASGKMSIGFNIPQFQLEQSQSDD